MDIQTTYQPNGEWTAVDADTYEAESDSIGWWSTSPVGYGRTAKEAIADLLAEIEDRTNAST